MIMFILTINYVVLFYYEMILYAVLEIKSRQKKKKKKKKKNNTFYIHTHEAFSTLPKFESNGSYFRSEYQSNKEYMPFLPVLIKLKSRGNNDLIFIVSHVT